jgi:hypothetical protein
MVPISKQIGAENKIILADVDSKQNGVVLDKCIGIVVINYSNLNSSVEIWSPNPACLGLRIVVFWHSWLSSCYCMTIVILCRVRS